MSSYIDKKTEKRPFQEPEPYRPQQWEVEAGKAATAQKTAAGYWQQVRWGTIEQKRAAAQALMSSKIAQDKGLVDMKVSDDGNTMTLIYTKESGIPPRPIPLTATTSSKEWAAIGAELHGIDDADAAVRAAGAGANKPFVSFSKGSLASRDYIPPSSDAYEKLNASLSSKPLADFVTKDGAEETASQLNAAYGDFGFEFDFDESTFGTTDDVIVKYNGQEVGKVAVDNKSIGAGNIASLMRKTLKAPAPSNAGGSGGTISSGNVR
jgi:hypothetical protein